VFAEVNRLCAEEDDALTILRELQLHSVNTS